ncbi:ATP-binding cassette domain-containing protein [Chryseolinea sp. T2]|uniref:ABC transporter ATP-binding protein n=1 Tax=Chryseolinea sp. T2 TaxID=3129255 RepID=UPI003076D696
MMTVDIRKKLHAGSGRIAMELQFDVRDGELLALFGPSGAGKTSVLRMIAGLLQPDSGTITVNNEAWFDSSGDLNLVPQRRDVGIVFQDYALFPNMTVRENIAYGLKKDQPADVVQELLDVMELIQMEHVRPSLLSGGQKQRVALARALARRPKVLLLDEPTSSLDAALRVRMQQYVKTFHEKHRMTTLLITHDVTEVIRLASRVLVLEQGTIKMQGAARDVLPLDDLRSLL